MIFDRILLTGAAGLLGRQLRAALAPKVSLLRSTDIASMSDPAANEELVQADLADPAVAAELVRGIDAVVHFGGISTEADFDRICSVNIAGFHSLYEAARQAGVKRIVFSSSVHTVGFHEQTALIDAAAPYRPDSYYGVSKVFGEMLAQLYWDKHGLETVSLRIGSCVERPNDRRHLLTWLSFADMIQLVERSLTVPRVGHMISYATSNNRASFWDNRLAAPLGYRPQDSSDGYAAEIEAKDPAPDRDAVTNRYQGGVFVD